MHRFYSIYIAATCIALLGCSHGYKIEDNRVYYVHWNEARGKGSQLLPQADASTFESLDFNCDCSFEFGKDKDHLYIDGQLIENIDPNTFRFIGNYIFADKDSAYFFGFYTNLNDCSIDGVNPHEIALITYPWAKSGNILINGSDTLSLADITDFTPIDNNWGKTKSAIIFNNQLLVGADPASFEIINSYAGKDNQHTFEFGKMTK